MSVPFRLVLSVLFVLSHAAFAVPGIYRCGFGKQFQRLYAAKQVGLQNVPVEVVPFKPRSGSWVTLEELLQDAAGVAPDRIRR